jgi:hypothetical protein
MRLIGELYRPTVGLLGYAAEELSHRIPGPTTFMTGEMDADEACAADARPELAVACHYLAPDEEVQRFLRLVAEYDSTGRRRVVAPMVGRLS